jgi:hypothetical protein
MRGGHEQAFRLACQSLAVVDQRRKLVAVELASPGNYWVARFEADAPGLALEICCNIYFPLVGYFQQGLFVDLPSLDPYFQPLFTVLPAAFLATQLDSDNEASNLAVSRLEDAEFAQFTYREPHTLADIVFHRWD